MINIFLRTKILTGLVTGGILLSSVSTTFAASTQPLDVYNKVLLTNECKQINTNIKQGLETNFEDLVATNNITEDQAAKIKAIINKPEDTKKTNLNNTVDEKGPKTYKSNNKISHINTLMKLVDNGTITEVQADKIIIKQIELLHEKSIKSYSKILSIV